MNTEKLDRFLSEMPRRGIPGCDLSVTRDGKEVYRRTVGYADMESGRPVAHDTLYWVFSATKVITCTAAMRLVEEGRLRLDDKVSDYLPAFGELTVRRSDGSVVPAVEPMRILHLFTMTGGLDYDVGAPAIREACAKPGADTMSICSAMAKSPLCFEPGTRYRYSLCHDVLAAVVEAVTGKRFSEYLREVLFEPLGMEDTGFRPTAEQKQRFAQTYRYNNADGSVERIPTENWLVLSPDYDSGGAGLFTSVDDYMKVITALACGGTHPSGYRVLRPETVGEMTVNRLSGEAWRDFVVAHSLFGYGRGLGGRVHVDPVRSLSRSPVGEFGWDGALAAYALVDPITRTAIFFCTHLAECNYAYHTLHPTLRDLVYEALGE